MTAKREPPGFLQRADLRTQLADLGLAEGDAVMAHAALRSIGPMEDRGATLVAAILDAVGPGGTLLAYTDWAGGYEHQLDEAGHLAEEFRDGVLPFDPRTSPATPDIGALAEIVRTWSGALRSASPGPSVAAVGGRAAWFVAEHPLDYGYGEGSPFARLVAAEGKVLMVGAPLDTMTLLHHAEHLAPIPGKRIRRYEVPFLVDGRIEWRMIEEFDTGDPVVDGLAANYFGDIVRSFLATGRGRRGAIGAAASALVPAKEIVAFAVEWLKNRFGAAD